MAAMTFISGMTFVLMFILPYLAIGTENVKIIFPGTSRKSYVKIMGSLPTMDEFTICFWKKVNKHRNGKSYMFSYATPQQPDMLHLWTQPMSNDTKKSEIGMNIGGDTVIASVSAPVGDLKSIHEWEHLCFGWSSYRQNGFIALDGCIVTQESQVKIKSGNDRHKTILKEGGVIILGQDQDVYGGGFEEHEGFVGEIFDLQMWNELLHPMKLQSLSQNCSLEAGNVLSWFEQPMELRGVQMQKSEVCHLAMSNGKMYCYDIVLPKPLHLP